MAEIQSKRLREEESHRDSSSKRQKPYNNILNHLLDQEEDEQYQVEPTHDLSHDFSAIFTTLQQELASASTSPDSHDSVLPPSKAAPPAEEQEAEQSHHQPTSADEDDGVKSVMRRLLEASDDELGIPNRNDEELDHNIEIWNSAADNFPFAFSDHHGLWELEDEAANYYSVLQSGLFM